MLAKFAKAGIHIEALGDQLQFEGAASPVKSWNELPQRIASKTRHSKPLEPNEEQCGQQTGRTHP